MSADYDFLDDLFETAPLDLLIGHLRTVNSNYRELKDFAFSELKGWYCPVEGWVATGNEMVATIQPFKAGGYEVTVKNVDMQSLGNLMSNKGAVTGKREKRVMNENDRIRSAQRAKKKVRLLIKQKGCDRLLTLTRRENNPDTFKNEDEWLEDFRKFVRLCRIAGIELDYVATLEKHKKGNFHLHAAIVGRVHINTVRKIWLQVCGGKGQGNVDISFKQHQTPTQRLAGVARYVSKYITKQLDNFDFNRKRYWASRSEPLEKPKKIILSAQDMAGALAELAGVLSLDLEILSKKVFEYGKKAGERAGAWFSYEPSMQLEIPF
ncbi:rolling circle replication-associated protein [Limnohabitans sp.]